ncbi:MAG TPA: hypothetical protein VM221_14100 [Armatimonadota bacterium]|nr:hypothetical protein [Armatimonadota bacterium]
MLTFDRKHYEGIRQGRTTVIYRTWDRPQVNVGRRYRCGELGDVMVEEITQVPLAGMTEADTRAAGAESLADWRRDYKARNPKADFATDRVYRVRFRYLGNEAERVRAGRLSEEDLRRLDRELAGIDVKTYEGEWTQSFIATLTQKRWMRPGELAQQLGTDQDMVRRKMGILAQLGMVRADPGLGYSLSNGGRKLYAYRMRA